MATRTTTSRSRSTGTRSAGTRKRATTTKARTAAKPRTQALEAEAQKIVRSVRTRASRAAKKVPTDTTTLSIAAGVIAGIVAAGVALFMNRDRVRSAVTTGSDKLRQVADDLSQKAHDRIDEARSNIRSLRSRTEARLEDRTVPVAETNGSATAGMH